MKKSNEIIKTASVGLLLLIFMTLIISLSAIKQPIQSKGNDTNFEIDVTIEKIDNRTNLILHYTELDSLRYLDPDYHRVYAWAR